MAHPGAVVEEGKAGDLTVVIEASGTRPGSTQGAEIEGIVATTGVRLPENRPRAAPES